MLQKAKKGDLGAAKKPVGSLYGLAKEGVTDLAEQANLGSALKGANKKFSQIRTIDDILPQSLLKGDQTSVNKVAQFLRKAEMEGMSGDDLRDSLKLFGKE